MQWQPSPANVEYLIAKTAELRNDDRPQWREVRERLAQLGLRPEDAALGEWENGGVHSWLGLIGTRHDRLFLFGVTFGFDRHGRPAERGSGWVHRWEEVPRDEIRDFAPGLPNGWSQAARIAKLILEAAD
ncbi:MAG TPA: hypothetical protein VHN37_12850 [Actinomycetota bacterium]|nr:hypothetical protein [Actinomycetota bacterium]